jgi:hypothetical protein
MNTNEYFDKDGNLTDAGIVELRRQVRLGSCYISDYENTLGLTAQSVCDFFEGYINEISSQIDSDDDYDAEFNKLDNDETLIDYLEYLEFNPFEREESEEIRIDRELRQKYSFVKKGAVLYYTEPDSYFDKLVYIDEVEEHDGLLDEDTMVQVRLLGGKPRRVALEDLSKVDDRLKYDVDELKRNIELLDTYKEGTWQRELFATFCDCLYYGETWSSLTSGNYNINDYIQQHRESECKAVYDTAHEFMATC